MNGFEIVDDEEKLQRNLLAKGSIPALEGAKCYASRAILKLPLKTGAEPILMLCCDVKTLPDGKRVDFFSEYKENTHLK